MNRFSPIAGIISIFLFLLAGSCSDNPAVRNRYQAEKMYFEAERQAENSRIRPDLNAPDMPRQLRAAYREVIDFCLVALDSVSAEQYPVERRELVQISYRASTRLTQLYVLDRRFDSSITIYERLLADSAIVGLPRIGICMSLGEALQETGRWDSALTVYQYAVENFYPPVDPNGAIVPLIFGLPTSIMNILEFVGDSSRAADQLGQAMRYYRSLKNDFPDGVLAYRSRLALAGLLDHAGRWEDAIDELNQVLDSAGDVSVLARERIADYHARNLDNWSTATKIYNELLDQLDPADSLRRPIIILKLALTHLEMKEPATTRQLLTGLKNNYSSYFRSQPIAQWGIARSFEQQDNTERAETEYKFLIEGYPGSRHAFQTYLDLAEIYRRQGRSLEAKRIDQRAEEDLTRLASDGQGTMREAVALGYLAELYSHRREWSRAAEILITVYDKFPRSRIGSQSLLRGSAIYSNELKNQEKADSLLAELKKTIQVVDETADF